MFQDPELDRLGKERDVLFARLTAARDQRKRLGQDCSRLHDDLDEAFRSQNRAYEANQAAWAEHKSFMQDCSQKIEFYRAESDRCHARMTDCFRESQNSWDRGDKLGAKSWSDTAKRHQSEMRYAKEQAAWWILQSKNSQYRFTASGGAASMEAAKGRTRAVKAEFDAANGRLKAAKAEVERLEEEFDAVKSRFNGRLDFLKRDAPLERQRRIDQEAAQAAYRVARAKELDNAQRGRDFQYGSKQSEVYTKVKAGWSREHDMPCTDILIFQQGIKGHHHIVIGENGQVFIDEWRHG